MKNKKIRIIAVVLSVLVLLGSTLAYYTDRFAHATATGRAGTLKVDVPEPLADRAKLVASYEDTTQYPITVSNLGNKLMDVRIEMEVQSGATDFTQGYKPSDSTQRYPYLYVFNTPLSIQFNGYTNYEPSFNRTPVTPTVTNDGKLKYVLDEYTVSGIANSSIGITDVENFAGDETKTYEETATTKFAIFFPTYGNDFVTANRNTYYRVKISVYAKQHMNTNNTDWELVKQLQI